MSIKPYRRINMHEEVQAMQILCAWDNRKKDNASDFINLIALKKERFSVKNPLEHLVDYLVKLGYIRKVVENGEKGVALTESGKCYFEQRARRNHNFWLKSIAIPIIVSIITTITTHFALRMFQ
jgi:hypothetical protein